MSATPSSTIPYERQSDPQSNRMCGAASLSMVYRSLGKAIPQSEIWPRISKQNPLGSLASATYLMAQDALNRGFPALAVQVRHPLQALRLCQDEGIRAVLSHRLREDSAMGHYTVLVEIDGQSVVVHDPYFGPSRRLPHEDLLHLWRPVYPKTEITGNVLIGVAAQPNAMPPCQLCGTVIPPAVACPACDRPVSLQPAALLGCVGDDCPDRMWNYICCPFCDYTWSFSSEASKAEPRLDPEKLVSDLNPLFAEMDKFSSLLLSIEGVGNNLAVRKELDRLVASKEHLKLAQSEVLVHRRTQLTWMTEFQQKCKQDEEDLVKAREEIQKPGSPLDGNALGKALLKDLGLITG